MISYSKRESLFEKGEWTWTVDDDALRVRDPKGGDSVMYWKEVEGVRLAYAPTRFKTWRHLLELKFRANGKMTIDNAHFAGVGNFEDRSAAYTPFVRAALAKVAQKAPDARCSLGAAPVGYWLAMIFVWAVFAALAAVMLAIPIDGIPGVAWVKLGIIAFFIPSLAAWMVKARPRGAKISEIPDSAFPRIREPT